MEQRTDRVFAAEARSVARSRTLIAQSLIDVPEETLQVVVLLTSELVTNAVQHGLGPIGVHVAWGDGAVRVEVDDLEADPPVVRTMDTDHQAGRGMLLVDQLSTDWGVLPRTTGKTVWFTIDGDHGPTSSRPLRRR